MMSSSLSLHFEEILKKHAASEATITLLREDLAMLSRRITGQKSTHEAIKANLAKTQAKVSAAYTEERSLEIETLRTDMMQRSLAAALRAAEERETLDTDACERTIRNFNNAVLNVLNEDCAPRSMPHDATMTRQILCRLDIEHDELLRAVQVHDEALYGRRVRQVMAQFDLDSQTGSALIDAWEEVQDAQADIDALDKETAILRNELKALEKLHRY